MREQDYWVGFWIFVVLMLFVLLLSSCGGVQAGDTQEPVPTDTVLPVGYTYVEQLSADIGRYEEAVAESNRAHVYEWSNEIENPFINCPTRIIKRDGEDFCIWTKCDGVGVALSCKW